MTVNASTRVGSLSDSQRAELARVLAARATSSPAPRGEYDVAILGGGIAGLALALQIARARPTATIAVIERSAYPVPETTHKVGESTVEIAAHYLRDVLGMNEHLREEQIRKFGLRMFFTSGDNTDITRRVEVGSSVFPPLCTYQLDRGRLENELSRRCREARVELINALISEVTSSPSEPHRVVYHRDGLTQSLSATWLVDATGRSQLLRRAHGRPRLKNQHSANAAWLRIAHPIDVNEWSADPEWAARIPEGDRSLSTNHLLGPGRWVWIIRLATGSTSLGIVAENDAHDFSDFNTLERALAWIEAHEPQLGAVLRRHEDQVQDFRVMRDYSYGCATVYDGAGRWCLTGESGLFLDPLYSPGLDLIAISNGLVTDLVLRSLDGEDVAARARIHDRLYRTVADIWLAIYRDQYTLMGNARVMSSKVIWDTAFYWGVFGTLFFNDKFRDLSEQPTVANDLGRLTQISNRMQQFYREWARIDSSELSPRFIDLYSPLDFMVKLHTGMGDALDDAEFATRFSENTTLLAQVAGQLVSTVIAHYAESSFEDDVVQAIQAWQRDPVLADLVSAYRRGHAHTPTSPGWIALDDDRDLESATPASPGPALAGADDSTAPDDTAHHNRPTDWERHDSLDATVVPA